MTGKARQAVKSAGTLDSQAPPAGAASAEAGAPVGSAYAWPLVLVALGLLGLLAGCEKVWNFDVFWQLTAGDWMLQNRNVLGQDFWATRYVADLPNPWVNVHWLFQVAIALVHRVGGFSALVGLKMGLLAGAVALLGLMLRGRAGPAISAVCLTAVVMVMQTRVRVRPEAFTFVYFALTMGLLEGVRRGRSANRLFWLIPIQLLWVNMHGLFVLGLALTWLAIGGAWMDRLLRRDHLAGGLASRTGALAGAGATLACLLTPWPLEVFLQPALLWTRVGGNADLYTYGVSELTRTWDLLGDFGVYVPLALAGAAGVAMLLCAARVPAAHWLWLAAFVAVGATAMRNTVFAALVAGPLAALWLSAAVEPLRRRRWARLAAGPAATVTAAAAAALGLAYLTGAVHRHFGRTGEPGFGLLEDHYPVDVARKIAQSALNGDVLTLNFGDAGAFMYYGRSTADGGVRNKLYMDGRLELHSPERFAELYMLRSEVAAAEAGGTVDWPPSVSFVVVGLDDQRYIGKLARMSGLSLFYAGRSHLCFFRNSRQDPPPAGPGPSAGPWPANLGEYDRPLPLEGSAAILEPASRYAQSWHRQKPPTTHWRLGGGFYQLDQTLLSVRYLEAADRLDVAPPLRRLRMLAQAHGQWARQGGIAQTPALPADMAVARAMWLFAQPGVCDVADEEGQVFDLQRIGLMATAAGQYDAALEAIERHVALLPPAQRFSLPADTANLRNDIRRLLERTREDAASLNFEGLTVAQCADLLARRKLPLAALELLDGPDIEPEALAMRGDIQLRLGRVEAARESYAAAHAKLQSDKPGLSAADVTLRLALCDWAEGRFAQALVGLAEAARQHERSLAVRYYQASLLEMLGRYDQAVVALEVYVVSADPADRPHEEVVRAVSRLVARLTRLGHPPSLALPA